MLHCTKVNADFLPRNIEPIADFARAAVAGGF
jgi:hypothetical protein